MKKRRAGQEDVCTFGRLIGDKSTFAPAMADRGRQKTFRAPDLENASLGDVLEQQPGTSARKKAACQRVSCAAVMIIYYTLQRLRQTDCAARMTFISFSYSSARDQDFTFTHAVHR